LSAHSTQGHTINLGHHIPTDTDTDTNHKKEKMATDTSHMPAASCELLFARSSLKDIDLALAKELQRTATLAAAPTLPDQNDRTAPMDAVALSARVAEELTQEEVAQAVKEVLGFSFPQSSSNDISVFSGYIFVNGKQLTWTRHQCNRMGGSRITLSLREEKDALLTSCLDARTVFALH
jgi:hypothetical protein